MVKALLVIGASAVSIDWDVRVGYSTMPDSSIPGGPGHNSSDGQMEPLGKTATWQKCEDLCANDTKCISFDYHGPVGRNWDRWCYKRINYQFPVIKEAKTRVCGWKNGPAPGPPAPSPGPGPGPAPTPSPDAFISRFSCAMRKLALSYAQAATINSTDVPSGAKANLSSVFDSLALQDCNATRPLTASSPARNTAADGTNTGASSGALATYWVSVVSGSDANSGASKDQAWKTIQKAVAAIDSHPGGPASRPATTVNILPGTYFLEKPLHLSASTSGASPSAPVTFQAWPGKGAAEEVVISGGRDLTADLQWKPVVHPVTKTKVLAASVPPALLQIPFDSLFVNDRRQIRARYPNGRPEQSCYKFDHGHGGANCPGFMQASTKRTSGGKCGDVLANNVGIYAEGTNTFLARGSMLPLDTEVNVTVALGPSGSAAIGRQHLWDHEQLTRRDFAVATQQQPPNGTMATGVSRYDLSRYPRGMPYWCTSVPDSMFYIDRQMSPRVKQWGQTDASIPGSAAATAGSIGGAGVGAGALLHIYQEGYWGNWQFEVKNVDAAASEIEFSRGGWQEARGGSIGGTGSRGLAQDFYIEGVFEELDSPREFHFDRKSSTLWYMPETDMNASAMQVVAPTLNSLLRVVGGDDIGAGGSREDASKSVPKEPTTPEPPAPVSNIVLRDLVLRHTRPTFMEPYESGQGGDWAYHRGGAIFVENAEGITIEGCRLLEVEGNAIFLSDHVVQSKVIGNECRGAGESCVVMAGSAELMNATKPMQPAHNLVANNHLHHFGCECVSDSFPSTN
jgi:hypothetical protein